MVTIDRAIRDLDPATVAELLRVVGETGTANNLSRNRPADWRAQLMPRLEKLPDDRLNSLVEILASATFDGSTAGRDLERVRLDLERKILEVKNDLYSRPVIGECRPSSALYERLPARLSEAARTAPSVTKAKIEIRKVGDDLRAELASRKRYGVMERAVITEVALRGIDTIAEGLNLTQRTMGSWPENRALISQGLTWLELAKLVLGHAEGVANMIELIEGAQRSTNAAFPSNAPD